MLVGGKEGEKLRSQKLAGRRKKRESLRQTEMDKNKERN